MVTIFSFTVIFGGLGLFISRLLYKRDNIRDFFSICAGVLVGFFIGVFVADQIGNFLPKETATSIQYTGGKYFVRVKQARFIDPASYLVALCPANKKREICDVELKP